MIAVADAAVTTCPPDVDAFLVDAALAYRARLAHRHRPDERALVEDTLTVLTDFRLAGIDGDSFEALLARMARGRSPVTLLSASPRAVADDIAAHWRAHRAPALHLHDA